MSLRGRAARAGARRTSCAPPRRQFVEGDVQHWWFPPRRPGRAHAHLRRPGLARHGRGALCRDDRRCGDPRRAACRSSTARRCEPGEHDLYFQPSQADETASLFEHCARGLDLSLAHRRARPAADRHRRLERRHEPRRRGGQGRERLAGLVPACRRSTAFAPIAAARGETERAQSLDGACRRAARGARARRLGRRLVSPRLLRRRHAARLGEQRGMPHRFDRPVLGGDLRRGRSGARRQAMAALDRQLVHRGDRLALLFTPPFDKTALDPGYIKGYPPGIRENGGQYTHAAAWSIMALRRARPGRQGGRAVLADQSDQPHRHARRRAALQGRALCRRRRRLFGGAACRARRLDLVHRLGRLALPRRHRVDPRPPRQGRVAA